MATSSARTAGTPIRSSSMGERLRFVFRNFPISTSHPYAEPAAEAAEADAPGFVWGGLGVNPAAKDSALRDAVAQDLDVSVRPMDADPLPIPDQVRSMLNSHDRRQTVLACDYRAVGHQAADLRHQAV